MKLTEEIKKLKSLDAAKLEKELFDAEKKYAEASLKVKAGKLKDYSSVAKLRKQVARIKTFINEAL
jgi:ribosomal protein L29